MAQEGRIYIEADNMEHLLVGKATTECFLDNAKTFLRQALRIMYMYSSLLCMDWTGMYGHYRFQIFKNANIAQP